MVQGDDSAHPHDTPDWLADVPVPTDAAVQEWDSRERRRAEALEMLGYGLLRDAHTRIAEAHHLLHDLPPIASFEQEPVPVVDPLTAAMRGWLTTDQLVDAYLAGTVELSEEQHVFIGQDTRRIRILALARKRDLGVDYLEEQLFPGGQATVALAARSTPAAAKKLADWLDEHPEVTGSTDTHWRA